MKINTAPGLNLTNEVTPILAQGVPETQNMSPGYQTEESTHTGGTVPSYEEYIASTAGSSTKENSNKNLGGNNMNNGTVGAIIAKTYGKLIKMKMTLSYDEVKDFINTAIVLPHTVEWQQINPQVFFNKLVQEGKSKNEAATICSKLLMLPLYVTDANGNALRNPTNQMEFLYYVEQAAASAPVVAPIIRFKKEHVVKTAGVNAGMNIYEMLAGGSAIDVDMLKHACAKIIPQEDLPYREDKVEGNVEVFCNMLGIVIDMLGAYGLDRSSFGKDVSKWSILASSKPTDQAIIVEVSKNSFKER